MCVCIISICLYTSFVNVMHSSPVFRLQHRTLTHFVAVWGLDSFVHVTLLLSSDPHRSLDEYLAHILDV